MGPITQTGNVWSPVERADHPAKGELETQDQRDRRGKRQARRRHQEEAEPDGDQFTHSDPLAEQ